MAGELLIREWKPEELEGDGPISPLQEYCYRIGGNRKPGKGGWSPASIRGVPGKKSTDFQTDGIIEKDNGSVKRAELEMHIYQGLKERGFPVVPEMDMQGSTVTPVYVRGLPLDVSMVHAMNNVITSALFGNRVQEAHERFERHNKLYRDAIEMAKKANRALNDILTDEQKAWVTDAQYAVLTRHFGIENCGLKSGVLNPRFSIRCSPTF